MQIVNVSDSTSPKGIYIGRGSPLGNPYAVGIDGDRESVIAKYKAYLYKELEMGNPVILSTLKALSPNSVLACHCHPKPCHGEIVEQAFNVVDTFIPVSSLTYAGIGSRKAPPAILNYMTRLATRLDELGFTLRSGGADGADKAFAMGTERKEVYLPWKGFNGDLSDDYGVSTEALSLAALLHPAFDRLSQGAQKLMARNGYQLLGRDLRSPAQFVICWTPDGCESLSSRSSKTGGTGQAIDLASRYNVPVFNLFNPDAIERLKNLVELMPSNHPR